MRWRGLGRRSLPEHSLSADVGAQDRHARLAERVELRFHGRDDLPAGVLHEHDRGDADVLNRPSIRFPHLFGVEYAHRDCGWSNDRLPQWPQSST